VTTAYYDQFIDALRRLADLYDSQPVTIKQEDGLWTVPPTTIVVCSYDTHLITAHRWQSSCHNCGQALKTGAVGTRLYPWSSSTTPCLDGGINGGVTDWQHGCGEVIPPTQHVLDLMEMSGIVDDSVNSARWRAIDLKDIVEPQKAIENAVQRIASSLIEKEIAYLHAAVASQQEETS
jgi:hypothetical protein